MSLTRDRLFEDWIDEARRVTVREELTRRGVWSARMNGDAGVPCPGCGGTDRFAVNLRKNVFLCRRSSVGGDAIALVQHLDGCTFLVACEILTGAPPPGKDALETAEDRAKREQAAQRRVAAENARKQQEAIDSAAYRERERRKTHDIWQRAKPIAGTLAEEYLALRGLVAPAGARLRFLPRAAFWDRSAGEGGRVIHEGPAMISAMTGRDGRFAGIEQIWLDLTAPKGKLLLPDPKSGALLPAKKTRGSWKGASVLIAKAQATPRAVVMGEGVETVASVYCALKSFGWPRLDETEFRAALSLNNLAGKAGGRIAHPSETKADARGRVRRVSVGNDTLVAPDDDLPVIMIGETIDELILLADGDSEPFMTQQAMQRAAKRFGRAYPWLTVRLSFAEPGADFNDMWREGAAA